jgi:DNA-directed RNA polymerase specialized sigma24 family protein
MAIAETFDEEEVRLLLAGDEDELAHGLKLIDQEYRLKLSGWLRTRFPGLTSSELSDCWQDTLTAMHKTISKGGFDLDRSVLPFVCTILRRRAIDTVRRVQSAKNVLEQIGYALPDTQTAAKWRLLSEAQRPEVREAIRQATCRLPEKQRIVVQAYVDGYPKTEEDWGELVRMVSERTGQSETLVSVKGSLREGLKKVREHLCRNGYGLGGNGEE